MKALSRLAHVPWLRRIYTALAILIPLLGLLYVPSVACFTLYCIALLAAFEHVKLRNAALQRLEDWCTRAHRKLHAEASAERQHTASEGTHGNCTQGMQTEFHGFSRHAYASWLVCRSHEALLYAWASAGFDLYFLCHFAVPLAMGSFVLRRNAGLPLAASLIAISAAGDTGALFCGSAFGHRRIIKRLSPNKTLAGVIGSLLFSWLTAALLWHLAQSYPALSVRALPLEDYLTIGALTSVMGFLGDLVESAYKRCAGVKDSSSIFGPHGGMLDRLDSLVLPIPALLLVLALRGHL
ncbi:uncharacterized protein LOC34623431 [Cyclospora cayetanensis]|uniref:Uncharacterized protein LOC34623431 n=1 Tax=Cyclospora cayetanensis TaxID=88456 RepID=A0A6P6S0G4_9EIME|nr:uncharacterized protein LOC34623431 [Cyclospora cayetanensis]